MKVSVLVNELLKTCTKDVNDTHARVLTPDGEYHHIKSVGFGMNGAEQEIVIVTD